MASSLLILMEYATCFEYAYGGIIKALLKLSKAFSLNRNSLPIARMQESRISSRGN